MTLRPICKGCDLPLTETEEAQGRGVCRFCDAEGQLMRDLDAITGELERLCGVRP